MADLLKEACGVFGACGLGLLPPARHPLTQKLFRKLPPARKLADEMWARLERDEREIGRIYECLVS